MLSMYSLFCNFAISWEHIWQVPTFFAYTIKFDRFFYGFCCNLNCARAVDATDVRRNTNTDHYYMNPWTSVVFIGYFKWIPSQSAKIFQTHQQIFQASRLQHFSSILKCKCKFIVVMHAFQYKASVNVEEANFIDKRYTSYVADFVYKCFFFFIFLSASSS